MTSSAAKRYAPVAAVVWLASLTLPALIGLWFGEIGYALQVCIFVLAGIPFALGVTGVLRGRWLGHRAAYRRGVFYLIVTIALVADGFYSVRKHQEEIAKREAALVPLIAAVSAYHAAHGAYPKTLEELPREVTTKAGKPLAIYYPSDRSGYVLLFQHNMFVEHVYNPVSGQWRDGVP